MRYASRAKSIAAVIIAIALLAPRQAIAQEARVMLQGRVTDPQGQGISGVEVIAQASTLPGRITTHTTQSGSYKFVTLPPGPYVVSFSGSGLVPVKVTVSLSLSESAVVSVSMHRRDGNEGAITVASDQRVFAPSWASNVLSRHSSLEQLPVTGTIRTLPALVSDLPGVRPESTFFALDGIPLRQGWRPSSLGFFSGPGREALQEITTTPGRLTVAYGPQESGAIEATTTRGANLFAGSVRAAFDGADENGDFLREARRTKGIAGNIEYTAGGALVPDKVWLFATGRHVRNSVEDRTALANGFFTRSMREHLGLARITLAPVAAHRFDVELVAARQQQRNAPAFDSTRVADVDALGQRTLSDRAVSAGYVGRAGRMLDLAVRYTAERGSTGWTGVDLGRTPFIDQQSGAAWWASPACTGCTDREVKHEVLRATADTGFAFGRGTHDVTFGYDAARSTIDPERASDSSRFLVMATRATVSGGVVFPVIQSGSARIAWIPNIDRGREVRTDAVFINDRWMANSHVSVDVGLRAERNQSHLSSDGSLVLLERTLSPRLFARWLLSERLPWTVNAGFARYTSDAIDRETDDAVRAEIRGFNYFGPSINTGGTLVGTGSATATLFGWFNAVGGTALQPALALTTPRAGDAVTPPHSDEWSAGVSRPLGQQGYARIDLTRRTYSGFATRHVDRGARTTDQFGRTLDLVTKPPSDLLEQSYNALSLKTQYRFGHYADVDAQYTLSSLSGNTDTARGPAGLFTGADLAYAEYFNPSWRLPVGNLPEDARHRFRMWAHSEVIANDSLGLLVVTLMHSVESGRPYGAAALVSVDSFVANPGYLQPPSAVLYYFTARDAFRTERLSRTDLGLNYRRRLPGSVRGELLASLHILNVFNRIAVLHPEDLIRVRTAFTDPSLQRFNPFTDAPMRGVHWEMDDSAARQSTANGQSATTLPRTIRLTVGIRF